MTSEIVELKEASKIEIISLMDNTVDFLSTNRRKEVQKFPHWAHEYTDLPFAEHGFSMLLRVSNREKTCTILYDTGNSPNGVVMNAKSMDIDLREVSYVVLSHGHYDHFGGLEAIVKVINKNDLPIIAHESMFKPRGTANSIGAVSYTHLTLPTNREV